MNCKVLGIMALVNKSGRCVIKLARESGMTQITVTKRTGDLYAVGTVPGSRIVSCSEAEVLALVNDNRIFIEKWYS